MPSCTLSRFLGSDLVKAMVLQAPGRPLAALDIDRPEPAADEIVIRVTACGVCRTDLHIADGDLPSGRLPIIPGHEIVGRVAAIGTSVDRFALGDRVGVPWLGRTCQTCRYCRSDQENLCDQPSFTGYQIDGGFAEYTKADARFCFPITGDYDDAEAAPLLCAGLIGHRSLKMAGDAERIGLYGFGAAAHIVAQVARHQGREVYAFTRPFDRPAQDFALSLGAVWASGSDQPPPVPLDAAIIFAPVGSLVPRALRAVRKGGTVVCGGIHMSAIPSFPYEILWGERTVKSVANLTRQDAEEFLKLAPTVPVTTKIVRFDLSEANTALTKLRDGEITGAAVLVL